MKFNVSAPRSLFHDLDGGSGRLVGADDLGEPAAVAGGGADQGRGVGAGVDAAPLGGEQPGRGRVPKPPADGVPIQTALARRTTSTPPASPSGSGAPATTLIAPVTVASLPSKAIDDGAGSVDQSPTARFIPTPIIHGAPTDTTTRPPRPAIMAASPDRSRRGTAARSTARRCTPRSSSGTHRRHRAAAEDHQGRQRRREQA